MQDINSLVEKCDIVVFHTKSIFYSDIIIPYLGLLEVIRG